MKESILAIDEREMVLDAFSAQSYYDRKGYYWFSLAKTKYVEMLKWSQDHAWMILICGSYGRYFIPFGQIKSLLDKFPSNRHEGRWDLYIRLEGEQAFFGVTEIKNHLDVTEQLHHFEQIWETPAIEEACVDEAIYIPDSLPEPEQFATLQGKKIIRRSAPDYDADLLQQVKRFQLEQGLKPDGIVDPQTVMRLTASSREGSPSLSDGDGVR